MFKSLQTGRAFAAVFVTLGHIGGVLALQKYFAVPLLSRPFAAGHAGVEFFFVLSGFIIGWNHLSDLGKEGTLARYLKKRCIRIYPLYWIVFVCVYAAAQTSPALSHGLPTDSSVLFKAFFLLPIEYSAVGGTGAPVLVVAWTLQYEMLFYAVFAVAIVSRMASVALIAALLTARLWFGTEANYAISFATTGWVLLFASGVGVAWLCRSTFKLRHPMTVLGAGVVLFVLLALSEAWDPGAQWIATRHVGFGACSVLLVLGAVQAEKLGRSFGKGRFVQLLGAASYSLYLVHFPLVSILAKAAVLAGLHGVAWGIVMFGVIFAACVCLGITVHLYVEVPVTRFLSSVFVSSGSRKLA